MFYNIGLWAQCYKTFLVSNLRIFVISKSPWQAFPANSNNHSSFGQKLVHYGKKFYGPLITESHTHYSLQRYRINYECKKFFCFCRRFFHFCLFRKVGVQGSVLQIFLLWCIKPPRSSLSPSSNICEQCDHTSFRSWISKTTFSVATFVAEPMLL